MKIFTSFLAAAYAKSVMHQSDVKRALTGQWISDMTGSPRHRRADIDGEAGFRPLATMMLYLQNFGSDSTNPATLADFESELTTLEGKMTNYGCYCWIQGTADGVIGGGKTKDMVDHHCKELYRCYKCVLNDYSANYTDVAYSVDFTEDAAGNRQLDCSNNPKQDGENVCECDKRFAENIAKAEQDCAANEPDDELWGSHCMDEQFRTINGGGSFNPQDNASCDKQFHGHDKQNCCGFYPNRYPYDVNFSECCRSQSFLDSENFVENFSVVPAGQCSGRGGEVVVNEEGNPHVYSVVGEN
ncbi:Oidioi.mRNA.OKI2018_I69.chr1.g1754.t1.cds [Oikopleura dioica]|uniref:Oidioi.mRNA.OKI2018_I69.chr1.g1754.t1.cds n=1 Tax=Oikopleura dioica TaxID=34765 RepID=A0ABN7SNW6_OIKDI|nr:Oidioi.mRNA.OKI2018_I69.chr1.g1754.t1.cds [Oikopleura dioica]